MERQTRVNKYKKLREEIEQMDTYRFDNPYQVKEENTEEHDVGMDETQLQTEYVKKNTLSISINQIIKAHDEYTTMIAKEDLEKKKKEHDRLRRNKILKIIIPILAAIVIVVTFVVLVIVFSN